jgi:hypothetical protein
MTEVCPIRSAVAIVGGSEDDDIVTTAERIPVERDWTKKNIRIVSGSLVGGRAIEVPVGELAQVGNFLSDSLNRDHEVKKTRQRRTPGDVPCSYNEVRRDHQSKRLREKVRRETVEAKKIFTFSLDAFSLVETMERGKKLGAVARGHGDRSRKCGE